MKDKRSNTTTDTPYSGPVIASVANHSFRKEWERAAWQDILEHLAKLRSRKELEKFLGLVLAPDERRKLITRTAALHRISLGISYRDISKELWLALQTITAIAKSVREHGYRSYRDRGKTERKKRVYSTVRKEPFKRKKRTKYGTITMPTGM